MAAIAVALASACGSSLVRVAIAAPMKPPTISGFATKRTVTGSWQTSSLDGQPPVVTWGAVTAHAEALAADGEGNHILALASSASDAASVQHTQSAADAVEHLWTGAGCDCERFSSSCSGYDIARLSDVPAAMSSSAAPSCTATCGVPGAAPKGCACHSSLFSTLPSATLVANTPCNTSSFLPAPGLPAGWPSLESGTQLWRYQHESAEEVLDTYFCFDASGAALFTHTREFSFRRRLRAGDSGDVAGSPSARRGLAADDYLLSIVAFDGWKALADGAADPAFAVPASCGTTA